MNHLLIDGDMVAYRSCAGVEREVDWGNDIWTLHVDFNEAKEHFIDNSEYIIEKALDNMKYNGAFEVVFCFSSPHNFRKKILPTYKMNRLGKRKPVAYRAMVDYIKKNYCCAELDGLEADDCMGIMATRDMKKETSLIISGDKDMLSVPCYHYDFLRDTFSHIDKKEAMYHFYMQTLMGDVTDGYSGCPRVGEKTAKKLLDKQGATWETVVKAYKKAGLSEEAALQQARVARILWASDYDFEKGRVVLWKP